MMNPMTVE